MSLPGTTGTSALPAFVPAGTDLLSAQRSLGVSTIQFKVSGAESPGLFILENVFHARGGPARHMHPEQDEWFFVLEGDFLTEVGTERRLLKPGDSLFAPRGIPHVWAFVGNARGRILVGFNPPGKMETFFREVTKENAMPPLDPELWKAHGMQLVGPPLSV
jgi:quercetin dioxygenase-like cupin family protein